MKPASTKLCRDVGEASALLRLLANPNRLSIVCYLLEGSKPVSVLESELGIRQPTLSQQLSELRDAGIISARRDGKSMIYEVSDPRSIRLVFALRGIYSGLEDVTGQARSHNPHLAPEDMMFD